MIRFGLVAGLWLADMALLSVSGPIGAHPLRSAAGHAAGVGLMCLMVRWFPRRVPWGAAFGAVFLLGIAARLLFWAYPVDDDMYRYIWEGHLQGLGINPYLHAPGDPALGEAASLLPGVREAVNQPHLPAAYPPLALLAFRGLNALGAQVSVYKAAFLLADIGAIGLLGWLLRVRGAPVSRLLLYAANPVAVVYIAGEAHLDAFQVLLMAAALLCFATSRDGPGFLCLGLAAMVKYLAVAAAVVFLRAGNRGRALWALLPLALYLPFADAGTSLFGSIGHFGARMHFNDAATSLLRPVFGDATAIAALVLLAAGLALILLTEPDPFRGAFHALCCLLLLLPTFHPWYLLLVLPFLPLFPSPAWIYLCAAVALTFPVLGVEWETGRFEEIHWVKWMEYLPFLGLLVWSFFRDRRPGDGNVYPPVTDISVVVPALNEADRIEACLASLRGRHRVREVVLVDGGSTDGTPALAAAAGVRVIRAGGGRGGQIRAGVEASTGDLVLVLHADSVLKEGACRRMAERLNARPQSPGGAMGMDFDTGGFPTGLVCALNAVRARGFGISFGDQAQFVRRTALRQMGGYPDLRLMEDVELSLRLKTLGKPLYVAGGVRVSGRRWAGGGGFGKMLLVLRLTFRYLARRRWRGGEVGTGDLYRLYYRRHMEGAGAREGPQS